MDFSKNFSTKTDVDSHLLNKSSDKYKETIQNNIIKQKGMTVEDWNKKWEDKNKLRRWELPVVHPFLEKYVPPSTTHPRALVPLAGKTLDLFWLAHKGYQVIGIECSSDAIKDLFDEQLGAGNYTVKEQSPDCHIYSACNNQVILIACDIFANELVPSLFGGPASFVWDRAALSALHPTDHLRYINKLKLLSERNAQYLFSVYWHSGPTDCDPPFPISTEAINKLFSRNDLKPLDELNSMNEEWVKVGYRDLCERCYLIRL